jgi:hypothetical protein
VPEVLIGKVNDFFARPVVRRLGAESSGERQAAAGGAAGAVDRALDGAIAKFIEQGEIKGKLNAAQLQYSGDLNSSIHRILLTFEHSLTIPLLKSAKRANIDTIICSPLPLGHGFVSCEHGLLPLPAPATIEILKNIPVYGINKLVETVTPTGAAIIATLAQTFGPLPLISIEKVGYGVGERKDNEVPNLLRIILGRKEEKIFILNPIKKYHWEGKGISENAGQRVLLPAKNRNPSADALRQNLHNRGSACVFLTCITDEAVPDVLWGQLYKSQRSLRKLVELSDFKVIRDDRLEQRKNPQRLKFPCLLQGVQTDDGVC